MKFILSILFITLFTSLANANDGRSLLKSCDPKDQYDSDLQTFYKTGCLFYIRGTMEAHDTFVAVRKIKPIYCPPGKLTFDAVEHIFLSWADNNREKLDWTAADAVFASLAEKFPCKKEKE